MKYKTGKIAGAFIILAITSFAFAFTASARSTRFTANLSGKTIVPKKVDTKARGKVVFTLSKDGKEFFYRLTVRDIDNVTMAHIHMESADKNGPPVAWLYPTEGMAPKEKQGRFSGILSKGKITAKDLIGPLAGKTLKELIDGIKSGDMYVVVHTAKYPDGELRGQISR
jgi:hypothetical protein